MLNPTMLGVSRSVRVQVDASTLSAMLRRASFDSPPAPVRILFTGEGITIWTMDLAKQAGVYLTEWMTPHYRVKTAACVLLACPKELADMLEAKCSGMAVRIAAEPNEPIKVRAPDGSGFDLLPADENECLTIPASLTFPLDADGVRTFSAAGGASASLVASMSLAEARKGVIDMTTSKAPYVEFEFGADGTVCRAGHWTKKTNKSFTPVDASIVHGEGVLRFTDNLSTLLSRFDSETQTITISSHDDVPLVLLESNEGQSAIVVAAEAIKEK